MFDRLAGQMFPTRHTDGQYHPKEWVLGVEVDGVYKAYPFSEPRKLAQPLLDEIKGGLIRVDFTPTANSAMATRLDGKLVPALMAFWFAWSAFIPRLWSSKRKRLVD
jgi:hypothetical protein